MNIIKNEKRENVELHNSWLALNSIVGCTNACKYCFMGMDKNCAFPHYYATPEEVIQELLQFRYYDSSLPICLYPNTDIFLNQNNVNYLMQTLDLILKYHIPNDLVVITKCYIPESVLERFQKMIQKGHTIVVYLSYSGLGKEIEPNVNHEKLRDNFRRLKEKDIPTVHYYRPFVSQNSDPKKIQEVLDYVHQYTPVSVVTGLMLDGKRANYLQFFRGLKSFDSYDFTGYSSVWPASSWNYFHKNYQHSQLFYRINTCAYHTVLKRPCSMYYKSRECKSCHCSEEQRERCRASFCLKRKTLEKQLHYYLQKLGVTSTYLFRIHRNNTLELIGEPLKSQDYIYLSHMLGILVYMKQNNTDIKYDAFHGEPYVLKEAKI